jgi:cytochrome c oxidase cbb3-type subunit I/II
MTETAPNEELKKVQFTYDDGIVRMFVGATILWGFVGMLVGVIIAGQLAWPELNIHPWLSFGRLRPLHTNAVIFAFVGNMIYAGVYYSTQRLLKAQMFHRALSLTHFWGWQLIIVAAAVTLPLGFTQGKEYAELEWPIDIAVTLIWVVFAVNFFGTIFKRREKHLYVALWFYIATILTVAMLYIVNNIAIPVMSATGLKSYIVYAGVQDALIQWWYGHNAVAFFLTTPVLGIMYYFLPKAVNRPVYSYRLSIVHFWALVFLYIWAGPHHLLYTALPDWAQSLGMVFSLMLWAPSWGGMLNGLLTLRGAWDKLRTDPVVKFLIAGVTFYGMATFEGPMLSIKSVSALGHYTDWIIGHVHTGALGWNGLMAAGVLYWLVPKLWGKEINKTQANLHFWLATLGILLYALSMWTSGITQGLMWREETLEGALRYPTFIETLVEIRWLYIMRLIGGTIFLLGYILMMVNLVTAIMGGKAKVTTAEAVERTRASTDDVSWKKVVFGGPVLISAALVVATVLFFLTESSATIIFMVLLAAVAAGLWGLWTLVEKDKNRERFHRLLEGKPVIFASLTMIGVIIGGVAEIVPTLVIDKAIPDVGPTAQPYRPLELHGRDLYVREGCYNCHSQMIRPFRSEKLRYGEVSTAGEFIYDHPFQWGSKRTGPDLHRVGGKYPDLWHFRHMMEPRETTPGSNMPDYAFMSDDKLDFNDTVLKVKAMKTLGVPYSALAVSSASEEAQRHAKAIAKSLEKDGVAIAWDGNDACESGKVRGQAGCGVAWDSEMMAMIAYLQRLGKHPDLGPLVDAPAKPEGGK